MRLVLLSDSDLPLYPASLVWRQLMAEGASRSGACDHPKQASPRHALWLMLACWPLTPTAQGAAFLFHSKSRYTVPTGAFS